MTRINLKKNALAKCLLVALAMITFTEPAWAIFGVWRRTAVRTAVVVGAAESNQAAQANAHAQANANAQATAKAQQEAAASAQQAAQANAAAQKAADSAAQANAAAQKSPTEQLKELQSLYDQKLITQSEYQASKTKILNQLTQ